MPKPRIAIAGFQHETNTFAPIPTTYKNFAQGGAWPALTPPGELIAKFIKLNIPIGGFINAATDWELVPGIWAGAEPGGYVSRDAFDKISAMICADIVNAGNLDGIYLDLHGAMVAEGIEDGEGEVLRRVREKVGYDIPIAVSLDLHGNMTPEFFELASAVTIYRTYPHIDMAQTGARAQALLAQLIKTGKPFAKAFRQLDYLIPLPSQTTMREPAHTLYAQIEQQNIEGVASSDIALGFPPADIHHCGASVFCYGTNQTAVDKTANQLLGELTKCEEKFVNPMVTSAEAVAKANKLATSANKPVVIADPQDNPGAGATGDTTGLLKALIEGGAQDAYLGMIWDPEAASLAHAAGKGGSFDASLGGRYPGCDPVKTSVTVEALGDGSFMFTGPMFGGSHARLGPMALLKINNNSCDVHIIVSTQRTQNADQEIYRHLGVEPSEHKILAVKSSAHFLADYEPIAEQVIFAEAAGANPCRLENIKYSNLRSGIRLGPKGPVYNR